MSANSDTKAEVEKAVVGDVNNDNADAKAEFEEGDKEVKKSKRKGDGEMEVTDKMELPFSGKGTERFLSSTTPSPSPSTTTTTHHSATGIQFQSISPDTEFRGSKEESLHPTIGSNLGPTKEKHIQVHRDVIHISPFTGPVVGTLHLTDVKFFFQPNSRDPSFNFVVPLGVVSRVEKIGRITPLMTKSSGITIFCKDMRFFKFAFNFVTKPRHRQEFVEELLSRTDSTKMGLLPFGLVHPETPIFLPSSEDGWGVYDAYEELNRMGIGVNGGQWSITNINEKYQVCKSYPAVWGIPNECSDKLVFSVSYFRANGRIPIISWLHPNGMASITRSAQPLIGLTGRRNKDDERYLQMILKANTDAKKLYVMDARSSKYAAVVRRMAKGGGSESELFYQSIERTFLDIPNIHEIRSSYQKLKDICYPVTEYWQWSSKAMDSRWLKYIKSMVSCAVGIVSKVVKHNGSVLVHCSDGWDRTPQLTSLSMILLDPYYRTIRGFAIVVEKEWISFGHKFHQRVGHGNDQHSDDADQSPVFLQWIDSVYQVTRQFPKAFEFNETFLITILDQLYFCQFGTFLSNTEEERNQVRKTTDSLWTSINCNTERYLNAAYNPETSVLYPNPDKMAIWQGYYCRWSPKIPTTESPATSWNIGDPVGACSDGKTTAVPCVTEL